MIHYTPPGFRQDPFGLLNESAWRMPRDRQVTYPAVNMWQGGDSIALTAELAGFDPDDIELSVEDTTLTLSGERPPAEVPEDAVWHRNERRHGKFVRSVRLPYRIDPDKVEARFVNGVLQIALQRPEKDKPRRIDVKAA